VRDRRKPLAIPAALLAALRVLLLLSVEALLAPLSALESIPALAPIVALLETALIAAEPVAVVVMARIAALALESRVLTAIIRTLYVKRSLLLWRRLELRLRIPPLGDNRLIAGEFVTFFAELIYIRRLEAVLLRMTAPIREFAALLHLLAISHNDAIVMLGVLQIVFSKNRIACRQRISGECHIFFGNMRRRAAYFGIGSG
jgi:hypothetical protein